MAEQLISSKKENNLESFIQFQKKILESIPKDNLSFHHNNKPLALLTLDELFEFLEAHFNEFHKITHFNAVVPFIHRSLDEWTMNWDKSSCDIGITLYCLLEKHSKNENEMTIVVQIITTILNFLKSADNYKDIHVSQKVFMELADILLKVHNEKLITEIICCLKLYMEIYPDNRRRIIQNLWSSLDQRLISLNYKKASTNTEIDILEFFYDEFYENNPNISENPTLIGTIQQLLLSELKDNRKAGYYLFRKMIGYLVKKLKNLTGFLQTSYDNQKIEQLWTSYINILETLEDEELDITTSYLKTLEQIVESKYVQTSWLEVIYTRLLTHGNIAVSYWIIKLFLKTFTYSDLTAARMEQLLKTSNSMLLYNHEGYNLDLELFKNFLKGDLTNLFELMAEIEWKSIPLYIWIKAIYDNYKELSVTSVTYEVILKLSSRVYNLDCPRMRCEITKLLQQIFKKIVKNMSIEEYVAYVETLYTTTTNFYNDFETFYGKLCLKKKADIEYIFSQPFYEIIVKNLANTDVDVNKFMKMFNDVPKTQHGWLRFIPYHYYGNTKDENIEKLNVLYDINTNSLKTCQLTDIITKFEQCLLPDLQISDDEQEESVIQCRVAAIAFYIQQKNSLDQEDNETLKIIFDPEISEYNKMMKIPKLWKKLCDCLENTNKELETWIIDEFLNRVCNFTVGDNILKYLSKTYDENTKNKYFEIILDKYPHIFCTVLHNYVNPLKLSNQSRFFNGDLEKDELRIEQLFCYNQFDTNNSKPISYLKQIWINGLSKYCNEEYLLYLLKCHKELSEKKPICEENSDEHRIKLRILLAICFMETKNIYTDKIFNEIWNILLNENNQLNICYIYEYIIGSYDTRLDVILEKLKQSHTLTPNQQRSIISVAYSFCIRRPIDNIESMDTVITNLISLTMCYNTETSILAQITLYKLLNTENFKNQTYREQIIQTIKNVMGTNLNEYLNDFRLHMHENQLIKWADLVVLFVTKAPFDDMLFSHYAYFFSNSTKFFSKILIKVSPQLQDQLNKCREAFVEKNK